MCVCMCTYVRMSTEMCVDVCVPMMVDTYVFVN